VRKVVNSYCKDMDDRDDLIQEITIQLWKSWANYNNSYKVSTWIYRIALNVAISFYRKNYRRSTFNQAIENEPVLTDTGTDTNLSERIKQLYYFISKFDEFNKALILLYLDEYSYQEMAEILGISKTNVSTKISRIKNQLRKEFNLK